MIGDNEFRLNRKTVIDAIEEYFRKRITTGIRVKKVEPDTSPSESSFLKVTIEALDEDPQLEPKEIGEL